MPKTCDQFHARARAPWNLFTPIVLRSLQLGIVTCVPKIHSTKQRRTITRLQYIGVAPWSLVKMSTVRERELDCFFGREQWQQNICVKRQ
jgi:hypothetical protein